MVAYRSLARGSLPPSARLRDNNFDALRLIFASMVVVFHAGYLSQSQYLSWTTYVSATFAVQAFFVVSGFLVTMSYENSSSLKSYASKRLRRIAPAYVCVVIVAALALSVISTLDLREYFSSADLRRYIGLNLALSNFSAPDLPGVFTTNFVHAVNGALWTIKIEVAFYCLVPLIVWAVRRFGMTPTLLTIFTLSILWKCAFSIAAARSASDLLLRLAKQVPGQLAFFAGGAWAYYRTRDNKRISFYAALPAMIIYAFSGNGWFHEVVAPICVTVIVYWAAVAGPRLPSVAAKGDISYGVYLYHFPLIQTFIFLGIFDRAPLAACILVPATVFCCAWTSWLLIERPFVHRGVPRLVASV